MKRKASAKDRFFATVSGAALLSILSLTVVTSSSPGSAHEGWEGFVLYFSIPLGAWLGFSSAALKREEDRWVNFELIAGNIAAAAISLFVLPGIVVLLVGIWILANVVLGVNNYQKYPDSKNF